MRPLRASIVAALVAASALGVAGTYTIRLVPFPTAEVADGRSQIAVGAQVFVDNRQAPDGTQVVFETDLGSFRESVVRTSGGWAHATLVAGGVPGIAHIKATVSVGDPTGSTTSVEFVKNREELSQARETIEATSTGTLVYANDTKVLEGVSSDKGVAVRYRDLEIHADTLQIDLQKFTLVAHKALVRQGRRTTLYDSYFLNLTQRSGVGLTNYPVSRPDSVAVYPGGIAFVETSPDGSLAVARRRMRFGMVEVGRDGDRPLTAPTSGDAFPMVDLSDSPSTVSARKVVVYARREIQFHRADIFVNNAKVLRFPLFVVQLNGSSGSPLVTEDILSVNNGQIALNYPHYLSLQPGLTSLLRFQTGQRYGQGLSGAGGASLNYELAWSKGDAMQGGFIFSGMGRDDWGTALHQFWRFDDRTTSSLQLDSPSGKSVFGSGSISRSYGLYTLALNGSQNQTLANTRTALYNTQNYGLSFDRNAERIQGTPLSVTYGLTANDSHVTLPHIDPTTQKIDGTETREDSGAGFTTRMFSNSINLDKASSVNASFGATKLFGPSVVDNGVALNGQVNLTRRINASTNAIVTYNYIQDGINELVTGRHSLSLMGNYNHGPATFSLSVNKGIDVERMNVAGSLSYRLTPLWRLSYSHFMNQYQNQSLTDYFYILSYRIGWREVGLTWSKNSHRPGLQLMNVNF